MIGERISLKGSIDIRVYDEGMNLKDAHKFTNMVVNNGKSYICERMTSNNSPIMSHMSMGTSNTAPVASDTALGNEVGRVALDSSLVTNNVISYVATFPSGVATGSIKEIAIFNDSSSGTMLNRAQINVNKLSSDTIVVSWNLAVQ